MTDDKTMASTAASAAVDIPAKFYMLDLLHHYGVRVRILNTGPGVRAKVCCPFHHEQTPSFEVNLVNGKYHCFGCGATGNAIDLVMAKEGLTRNAAMDWLVKRYGTEVSAYIPKIPVKVTLAADGAEGAEVGGPCSLKKGGKEMEMVEYLKENYREPTPGWLKSYQKGQPLPLREFLHSRTVFYPAAGTDGHPVQVFGSSHSVHCFVFVDFATSDAEVRDELHGPYGFRGYSIIDERKISEKEMLSAAPLNQSHLTIDEMSHAPSPGRDGGLLMKAPFALFVVLERLPEFGEEHGGDRLAMLFLCADGFATYDALFANHNATPPFAMLVEDYGMTSWAGFCGGALGEKIAARPGVYPELLLTMGKAWKDYERIEGVKYSRGGRAHAPRSLYKRKETHEGEGEV